VSFTSQFCATRLPPAHNQAMAGLPKSPAAGQVYALLDQPSKAIAAYRQAVAKGYNREEICNDPENAKLQSLPELVELCRTNPAK
jgi:hypothetical protein